MYGQDGQGGYHLFELVLDKGTGVISVTVKSDIPGNAAPAALALAQALRPLPLVA